MTEHPHAPISVEEMAHAFEEEAAPVDLSHHAIEDWVTLAVFWGMGLAVFLQFFTRYVLNNSFSWTEEIAANCLVVVVFMGSVMCVRTMRHIQVDLLYRFLPARAVRVLETVVDVISIAFFASAKSFFAPPIAATNFAARTSGGCGFRLAGTASYQPR